MSQEELNNWNTKYADADRGIRRAGEEKARIEHEVAQTLDQWRTIIDECLRGSGLKKDVTIDRITDPGSSFNQIDRDALVVKAQKAKGLRDEIARLERQQKEADSRIREIESRR